MSVLTPEVVDLLMNLSCPLEEKTALMKALVRAGQSFQPPAQSSGVNEEQERIRNASTYAERKRKKDRERQARIREERRQSRDPAINRAMSRDVAATEGDTPATTGDASPSRTGAQVVIPSLPHLRSEEVGVGGGVGREREVQPDDWPDGKASDHADALVSLVASPWLDPNKSPDLVTTRGRLAAWKREGASWEHDVVPVVTGLCANRRSRIASWKFFDAAISRSIAENRAALEIPEARPRATGPPRSFADEIAAQNAEARRRVLADDQ